MKKLLAAVVVVLFMAAPAAAEVVSLKVCNAKTLNANTTTDCVLSTGVYPDISSYLYFSYQIYCGETSGDTMDIDVDWVAGSMSNSAYMGVPILSTGSAMAQLRTNYTTEDAWSVLHTIQPPVAPVGTIRFTENNNDADIVCTAILNMGR